MRHPPRALRVPKLAAALHAPNAVKLPGPCQAAQTIGRSQTPMRSPATLTTSSGRCPPYTHCTRWPACCWPNMRGCSHHAERCGAAKYSGIARGGLLFVEPSFLGLDLAELGDVWTSSGASSALQVVAIDMAWLPCARRTPKSNGCSRPVLSDPACSTPRRPSKAGRPMRRCRSAVE